jgi:chemotaxis signal transduction protein
LTTDISTTKASLAERQIVVFSLHNELYGVDINVVREIIRMQSLTNVPETSSYFKGAFNLRRAVTPVIDLRKRLDLIVDEVTTDTRIVVDGVDEVLRIKADSIEPTFSIYYHRYGFRLYIGNRQAERPAY